VIWSYLEKADLSALYARIRARAHTPGRPPPDPRVVLALWLYACVEGVGSARQLERLSAEHNGFRWLRGGVPLNYHLLSDFRWQAAEVADRLLTQGVAALWSEELITLASLTQDGIRVRAAAGASSYRRLETLKGLLAEVGERVGALKREIDADPDASNRRMRAAQARAAREQQERIAAALAAVEALEAEQAAKAKETKSAPPADGGTPATGAPAKKKEPRASTTDPQARVMRMPDGGYRPAYNGQITGDLDSGAIVGVGMDTSGSDGGLMKPAAATSSSATHIGLCAGSPTVDTPCSTTSPPWLRRASPCSARPSRGATPRTIPQHPGPAIRPASSIGAAAWSTTRPPATPRG
jgi:transposase